MEKLDQLDVMQAKVYEAELGELVAKLEAKRIEFQAWIDALWVRYGKVKGEDEITSDGAWRKIEKK